MAKIVIASDGTWHDAEVCYLVEIRMDWDAAKVADYLDTMTREERSAFGHEIGLPINEL